MGNKLNQLVKKKGAHALASILTTISLVLIFNIINSEIAGIVIVIISLIVVYFILNKINNNKISLLIASVLVLSIISLIFFIMIELKFNDSKIINKLLSYMGKEHYVGESRNNAISFLFSNIVFPTMIGIYALLFSTITLLKKDKTTQFYP